MRWLIPLPIREREDDESRAQGEEMQKLSHLGWREREGGGGGSGERIAMTLFALGMGKEKMQRG